MAWAGPPSGEWGASRRETRESSQLSQGSPALTLPDGNAQTGCIPQKLGRGVQPSWGARCPCTGRWRNLRHPVPSRVPCVLTPGPIPKPSTISDCPTCGQETPRATPKSERHRGAGGMAAGSGRHRHPLVGQPFPEPQTPESWVVS